MPPNNICTNPCEFHTNASIFYELQGTLWSQRLHEVPAGKGANTPVTLLFGLTKFLERTITKNDVA